jgi:hypothetical protein
MAALSEKKSLQHTLQGLSLNKKQPQEPLFLQTLGLFMGTGFGTGRFAAAASTDATVTGCSADFFAAAATPFSGYPGRRLAGFLGFNLAAKDFFRTSHLSHPLPHRCNVFLLL